jgi:hypothetical protein
MELAGGRVAVLSFDLRTLEETGRYEAPATAVAQEWTRPIVDRRQILWMSSAGQLVVKRLSAAPELSFLPWDPGITPRFELGSPYASADGQLWQQCFRDDADGGSFVFVQVGRPSPAIRLATSPRLSTGVSSFKLEALLRSNPWSDPVDVSDSEADEVIIPILESLPRSTLLCARVPSTSSVDSVLASNESFLTTFELRGELDVQFARDPIGRPWLTRPFVYGGCLYLYHPDLPNLRGWRMSE